jgi:hypothetical protein
MSTRESYVKHNSLMLVQGNVGRVKKLGVVVGKSGRGLNITLRLAGPLAEPPQLHFNLPITPRAPTFIQETSCKLFVNT